MVRWTRGPCTLGWAATLAAVAACSHAWDAYDPRLGSGAGGEDRCLAGETQACYSGPEGTEGVGPCASGVRTCTPAGVFGPCAGEVTPAAEDCATDQDDDCDGEPNQIEVCGCVPNQAIDCYEGPDGTLNAGICEGGIKRCAPDGLSYGECVGQTLPTVESCVTADAEDEDCNGQVNDRCAVWAKRFGGPQDQYANAFALSWWSSFRPEGGSKRGERGRWGVGFGAVLAGSRRGGWDGFRGAFSSTGPPR